MAWNDKRPFIVDVKLFRSLFPEQTKTPLRIAVWSVILFADVILCVVGACYFGVLTLENSSEWTIALLAVAAIALFWLQGVIYGMIVKWIKRDEGA